MPRRSPRAAPLPELSFQYGDFAAWQQRMLDRARREELAAYWTSHFDGDVTWTTLSPDRDAAGEFGPVAVTVSQLAAPCATGLRVLSRRAGNDPFRRVVRPASTCF